MNYYIGVDIGTSGTKTVLFDVQGKVIASASAEYPLYQPQNGYAEQKPEDWADAALNTIAGVMQKSGVNAADVKGIGLSGQMHGLVMLDKDNKVIRPAIIWCDQRTAAECEEITERVGKERLIEITANPALTGFTASKILWVRNHEPENYAKCKHILLPKDYIRFVLTNEYATEVSDASGMQLLDIPNRCWSDEVLEKLDIDKALLAKVYESPEITGKVTAEVA
ncbi:MAG: xylulokinase, partial [Oscillospiraceae bacterium]|nr:xylulokinase [Oscillospiraceae bacterium]